MAPCWPPIRGGLAPYGSRVKPRTLAAGGAAAIALCLSAPAPAQDAETWRYQCLGDETLGSKICTTELAVLEDGEEFIVYFVHTDEGQPPLVVAGEIEDMTGATIAVDKEEPLSSESCEGSTCYFSRADSTALMAMFRKGFQAKVTIWGKGRQIVFDRRLTLRGFSAALIAPPE